MEEKHLESNMIKVAVLTGGHPYDAPNFNIFLRSIPDIDYHIQSVEEFCTNFGSYTSLYDAVVFFNMTRETPQDEKAWNVVYKKALEDIALRGQGIVVLHHALLAFEDWDTWTAVTGLEDRKNYEYYFDQNVALHIENREHPITRGISDWEMKDETYLAKAAGAGSSILITTDNKASMKAIAWTRQYGNSRVFCFQSGHDRLAYENPNFRGIFANGIRWVCRKGQSDDL